MSLRPIPPYTAPTPWLLLRGLTRGAVHWGSFAEQLAGTQPCSSVTCLDLPGNGSLCAQPSPARVATMTDHARLALRARGVAGPVHVLAMSLGAMVACDWAARYPEELAGAVLINTSLRPFNPWHQRLRPSSIARLLPLMARNASARVWESTVLSLTSRLAPDPAAILADWVRWRAKQPVSKTNAWRQLLAAARYRAPEQAPAVRMLVLVSGADALVNPACSHALARHWNLPWAEHPQAGHDLPLDDPDWVIQQVVRWLGAHATAPAAPAPLTKCSLDPTRPDAGPVRQADEP